MFSGDIVGWRSRVATRLWCRSRLCGDASQSFHFWFEDAGRFAEKLLVAQPLKVVLQPRRKLLHEAAGDGSSRRWVLPPLAAPSFFLTPLSHITGEIRLLYPLVDLVAGEISSRYSPVCMVHTLHLHVLRRIFRGGAPPSPMRRSCSLNGRISALSLILVPPSRCRCSPLIDGMASSGRTPSSDKIAVASHAGQIPCSAEVSVPVNHRSLCSAAKLLWRGWGETLIDLGCKLDLLTLGLSSPGKNPCKSFLFGPVCNYVVIGLVKTNKILKP